MAEDPAQPKSTAPFFLVGATRSGTTLLRLMLGHHPQICRCEEMEFVTPALAQDPRVSTEREDYLRFLRNDRGFLGSGYTIPEGLGFEELAHDFMRQRREIDGKPLFGSAVHHYFDELPRLWPKARYIYLRRDPRDVARSCIGMGWAGTAWGGALQWCNAHDAWQRLSPQVPEDRKLELRFEDLVANAPDVLERACSLLGVDFDPCMLEIERDTTYSRPNPKEAKSWRNSASPREVAQVEARVGAARLAEAGYEPSGEPPMSQDRITMLGIQAEDMFKRIRFRQRRYGIALWAAGVASRRVPSRSVRERVKRRLDAIDNQHLK